LGDSECFVLSKPVGKLALEINISEMGKYSSILEYIKKTGLFIIIFERKIND